MRICWYAAALAMVLATGTTAGAGTAAVTYDFFPTASDNVAAVLVFASPPARADAAWSSADTFDVLEFTLLYLGDPSVQSSYAASSTGRSLDDGGIEADIPGIPIEAVFSAVRGGDTIDAGPLGFVAGDWLLQGIDPAPEPAGWLLLAVGTAAIVGIGRRTTSSGGCP